MSYVNMIMYGAVLPSYEAKDPTKKKDQQDTIKVDDPNNRERVKQIFDSID